MTQHRRPHGTGNVLRRWAVASALALFPLASFAGYAQMQPPATWTLAPNEPAGRGLFTPTPAANGSTWQTATARTTASLNVAGNMVKVPASMSMAANAGRYAARFAWSNPLLFAGAVALPLALDYFQDKGFFPMADAPGTVAWFKDKENCVNGQCYEFSEHDAYGWHPSMQAALNARLAVTPPPDGWSREIDSCTFEPTGCTVKSYQGSRYDSSSWWPLRKRALPGSIERVKVSREEMEEAFKDSKPPDDVANELARKGAPLPVELPVILPSPNPVPWQVPTGAPQPVPNSSPQQYQQPVANIRPGNNPLAPWQVDLTQDTVSTPNPQGVPNPTPVPETNPEPEPKEDPCPAGSDLVSCAKLDSPDVDVPTKEVSIAWTPYSLGFGGGACPAPITFSVTGGTYTVPYTRLCDILSTYIKPLLLMMAALGAIFIIMPRET